MDPNDQVSSPRDGRVSIEIETEEDDETHSTGFKLKAFLGENVQVLILLLILLFLRSGFHLHSSRRLHYLCSFLSRSVSEYLNIKYGKQHPEIAWKQWNA